MLMSFLSDDIVFITNVLFNIIRFKQCATNFLKEYYYFPSNFSISSSVFSDAGLEAFLL